MYLYLMDEFTLFMEVPHMKKLLSFLLILSMLLCMSVSAFAASPYIGPGGGGDSGDGGGQGGSGGRGGYGIKPDEVDLEVVPEPAELSAEAPSDSSDDKKVECVDFVKLTPEHQEEARREIARLLNAGYRVVSGFAVRVVGAEGEVMTGVKVTYLVPDGCDIFVNGKKVTPFELNGKLYIEVTTLAYVLMAFE